MKDNLSIVITMIVLVLLLIIFPLYNTFERQDDMSYNLVLKATTNFADEVMNAGYLDQRMYNNFVDQLANTGNIYDIQLEAHRRVITDDPNNGAQKIEQYIIDYNKDIFDENGKALSNINGKTLKSDVYYFNEGDKFYVRVKNSNTTMAGAIFNTIVPTSKKDRITANYGGIIKNVSWKQVDSVYMGTNIAANKPILTASPDVMTGSNVIDPGTQVRFTATSNSSAWWKKVDKFIWTITDPNKSQYTQETKANGGSGAIVVNTNIAGAYSVTVYAVDTDGESSGTNGTAFLAMNNFQEQSITSTGQAKIESVEIESAKVKSYQFDVTISSGHSGNDWWKVEGYVKETDTWETVSNQNVSNGVHTSGSFSTPKYTKLRFIYSVDSGHQGCIQPSNSKISYKVTYAFD